MFSLVKDMGLISDLLRDAPLKPEQLENIALVEKRMQDEKVSATRELERLKTEYRTRAHGTGSGTKPGQSSRARSCRMATTD